jgi:predicted nucleic acid-binding protein
MNILKRNWGFDSNILIYSFDEKSLFFRKAYSLFEFCKDKNLPLYLTQQNIVETERVLIHMYKVRTSTAIEQIEDIIDAFNINILTPLPNTYMRYHEFLKRYKNRDIFDLFLAATYIDNGIHDLFTVNTKDFYSIPDFNAVNPLTLTLED